MSRSRYRQGTSGARDQKARKTALEKAGYRCTKCGKAGKLERLMMMS